MADYLCLRLAAELPHAAAWVDHMRVNLDSNQ
jgi:hypothetical protein